MKKILLGMGAFCLLFIALASHNISTPANIQAQQAATSTPRPAIHKDQLQGPPTISARFIDQVLAHYHSPAQGIGQTVYDLGIKYGIDPVFALAFYMHESQFGTTGLAQVTHSWGNQRCLDPSYDFLGTKCVKDADGVTPCNGGGSCSAWFPSIAAGAEAWYRCILKLYINSFHATTVAQIINAGYVPRGYGASYIQNVRLAVATWRSGQIVIK